MANDLKCSEDKVNDILREALKAGEIESKEHRLWEDGRIIRRRGYRIVPESERKAAPAKK